MNNYKEPTFIRLSLLCVMVSLLVIIACQKKRETSGKDHPIFSKTVGGPIDSAIANSWKRNLAYKLSKNKTIASTATVYYLPAALLSSLINSEDATGISFYYGQDSLGNICLMPIGVNNQGSVIRTEMVQTTNGAVSWATAVKWHKRFKETHSNETWAHFEGSDTIKRLLEQGTEQVRIELGLDEQDTGKMMFSNAALENLSDLYDLTRLCPENCPSGFDEVN